MDRAPATEPRPDPAPAPAAPPGPGERRNPSVPHWFRNRLIGGLIFALPIAITFSIVYWLLITLQRFVLNPLATLTTWLQAYARPYPALENLPSWW
jgi:hypothetical protein